VKVLVLRAAGTNCDFETAHAFERVGAESETRHVNQLIAEPSLLHEFQILAFPGGFSYGDDVAAGRILATELKEKVLPDLRKFVDNGGLALGICNGFQVLVNTGLLPGTLTHNASHRYIDKWVELEVKTDTCAWLRPGETYFVPIAHAEGKYVAEEATLDEMAKNGQVALTYAENPNGSHRDIAGVCDETGRVLGLMPHPERHMEPWHHPHWTRAGLAEEADGLRLFRNAVESLG
jgi:phosphoribosylformylglycinamidine synthase